MVSQAGAEPSARTARQNVIADEIKYSRMFNIYRGEKRSPMFTERSTAPRVVVQAFSSLLVVSRPFFLICQ